MGTESGRVPLAPGSREPSQQAVSAASGFDPSRGWSKIADHLFEAPTDALGRINLWCSAIALAGVGGIIALWIVTEIV